MTVAAGYSKHRRTDQIPLRRDFATVNAESMTADALQSLMRHKSYATTQRYINMARQLNRAVAGLHVPDVLKSGAG